MNRWKKRAKVLGDVCGVLGCKGVLQTHYRKGKAFIRCSVCRRQRLPRTGELEVV